MRRVPPLTLLLLGLLWHGYWALGQVAPVDWDPAYYFSMARQVAAGEAPVTHAIWNLSWIPEDFIMPAHLHWMPLASWVLVPFLWLPLDGWRVAQAVNVAMAAAWGPLAWATAARMKQGLRGRWVAGLLAVSGAAFVRYCSSPDSIALGGLLGGLAFLATLRGDARGAGLWAALMALTRGEGFLVSLCCSLGFKGWRRWALAAVGPLISGLWGLHCLLVAGDAYAVPRQRILAASWFNEVISPHGPAAIEWPSRLAAWSQLFPWIWFWEAFTLVFFLPLLVFLGVWRRRAEGQHWPLMAYLLALPLSVLLLVPAIGTGSLFRGLATVFVPLCAWAAVPLDRLSMARVGRLLFPVVVVVAAFFAGTGMGLRWEKLLPGASDDCEVLEANGVPPGARVFAFDPFRVAETCGHPALIASTGMSVDDYRELSDRYGLEWALAAPADMVCVGRLNATDFPALVDDWEPVDQRLLRRRRAPASTPPNEIRGSATP